MSSQRKRKLLILSILMVLFSSWSAGNLMNIDASEGVGPLLQLRMQKILLTITLISFSLVIIYGFYVLHDKDKMGMIGGLLLILFWVFSFLGAVLLFIYPGAYLALRTRLVFPLPEGVLIPAFVPDIGFLILLFLIGFSLFYMIFLSLASTEKKKKEKAADRRSDEEILIEEEEKIEESISSTLDRAIGDLTNGEEIRSTIINCYREMSQILEESGAKNDEFLTPREFKDESIENISVPEDTISEITYLFEEARYSPHQLGEDERKRALQKLKELKEGMR